MDNNTPLGSEQNPTAAPHPVINENKSDPTDASPATMKWKMLFIGIFFIILSIPAVAAVINLPKIPLRGTTGSSPVKPIYSVKAAFNGSYPYQYEAWFNQNFPFRAYLVRSYFQLRYSLFRTCGADGVAFMTDDNMIQEAYIKSTMGLIPSVPLKSLEEYTGILRAIQDKCDALGKKYIHIIPAGKAEILKDKIPLRYRLASISNNPPDLSHKSYDRMKAALDKAGVRYVDGVKLLSAYKNPEELFSKTGVHWNHVATALVMKEAVNVPTYGLNIAQFKILDIKESVTHQYYEDLDIFYLSNIFTPIKTYYHTPIFQKASGESLSAFLIGTSFNTQIARVLKDSGLASNVREIRYSQTLYEYKDTVRPTAKQVNHVSDIDFASYISSDLIISTSSPLNVFDSALDLTARRVSDALGRMPGEPILFTKRSDPIAFLRSGWSGQENIYRWTEGPEASLNVNILDARNKNLLLRVDAGPYLGGGLKHQAIGVMVNDHPIATWEMTGRKWYEAQIPSSVVGSGLLNISFQISNPTAPCEISNSKDCRKLGMAAREIVIEEIL